MHGEKKYQIRCKECKTKSNKSINGLIEKSPSIYQFCNGDHNKFVLLLRKGVYPYEDMDSWKKFDETSLPDKGAVYNELTLEEFSDKDYAVFEIRNRGEYHDCMFSLIHYCLQIFLKNLKTRVLIYTNLILLIFYLRLDEHSKPV